MISLRQLFSLVMLLVAALPSSSAAAQGMEDSTVRTSGLPFAVWGAAGVGPGSAGVAGIWRVNGSVGPAVLMYRNTDIGPFISAGSGVRDGAVLVGARTSGSHLFGVAAVGYAHATSYHQSDNSGPSDTGDSGALAFDVSVHASAILAGLSASVSGNIGPPAVSYSAFTISLELGWFGW